VKPISATHIAAKTGRRRILGQVLAVAAWVVSGVTAPLRVWAAGRNEAAFESKTLEDALAAAGVAQAEESGDIVLRAPDIAENSALVHVEIESRLPGTESILVFAEKNPQPFIAEFDILPGLEPFVAVRIKMAESAHLRVVVRAAGRTYYARRETKVTIGGCAG
jgi:sulfur-oxidizing protein SoxY